MSVFSGWLERAVMVMIAACGSFYFKIIGTAEQDSRTAPAKEGDGGLFGFRFRWKEKFYPAQLFFE